MLVARGQGLIAVIIPRIKAERIGKLVLSIMLCKTSIIPI